MKVEGRQLTYSFLVRRCFSCRSTTVSFRAVAAIICTMLSILCSAPISAQETELLPLCPAGSHLSPSPPVKCLACKGGSTYMDRLNRENACYPCTKCDSLMVQVTPCSVTADALCECHEGYFKNVEGKCSPKLTSPAASTDRPYLTSKPVVDSSTSADTTGHKLDIIIGLVATAVVVSVIYNIVRIMCLCRQQKRTHDCTLRCTRTDVEKCEDEDEKKFGFHPKKPKGYEKPGQVADEQDKLLDQSSNLATGLPSRQVGTSATIQRTGGLEATDGKDCSSSTTGIQAHGEKTTPTKFEGAGYVVDMGKSKVVAPKCESSEGLSGSGLLGNSTISSDPMTAGSSWTSV